MSTIMKRLAGIRLQFGRRLLALLAGASLLVSGVSAGPNARPKALGRGEVPKIVKGSSSKRFLVNRIVADKEAVAGQAAEAESYERYADRLTEVLATFSPEQQSRIFHGK